MSTNFQKAGRSLVCMEIWSGKHSDCLIVSERTRILINGHIRTAKLTNLILFHPVMQRTLRSFSHLRHLEFDFCGSPIQNTNFRLLFTALQLKHLTSLKVDLTRQSSDWYSSRYCSLVHRGRYKRSREPYFVSFDERRTMIEHIQSEAGRGEVCQLKQLDVRVKILDMSYGGMRCGDDRYSDVRMMMEFLQPAVKDLEELKLAIYAQVFHRDTAPPVWDRETPMWELPKLKTLQVDWDQWGKFGKWLIDWNKDAVIIDNYAEDV